MTTKTRKRPRKFDDEARTVINKDWLTWAEDEVFEACYALGQDPAVYFPEQYGKGIPEEGAWIRVIDVPHTVLKWDVPPQSMWRARPFRCNFGYIRLAGQGRQLAPFPPMQAVIATPGGDLHLWPHEYVIVPDITEWVGQEPDCTMHTLGGEPVLDDEKLWYIQSRGIPRHEAAILLLNSVQSLDFVYFTMHEWYIDMFDGVGTTLATHMARYPRTNGKPFKVLRTMAGMPIPETAICDLHADYAIVRTEARKFAERMTASGPDDFSGDLSFTNADDDPDLRCIECRGQD